MWHILRHLTHSSGDMATICYIFIGEQSLIDLTGTLNGLVYRIRGEWGSRVTFLLRYTTRQFIVITTTIRHSLLIPTITYSDLLGPTLIHTEHNQHVYRYFATSSIVNLKPKLKYMSFMGSYRTLQTVNGLKISLPLYDTLYV